MQPSFGLVTALTAQSHRMAEAGLWAGPGPAQAPGLSPLESSRSALLEPRVELSPLPAALRIPNSPSTASAALGLIVGSAEPLCQLLCPLEEDPNPLQELPPAGIRVLQFPQEGLESANSYLRLLLSVEGLILLFPH